MLRHAAAAAAYAAAAAMFRALADAAAFDAAMPPPCMLRYCATLIHAATPLLLWFAAYYRTCRRLLLPLRLFH